MRFISLWLLLATLSAGSAVAQATTQQTCRSRACEKRVEVKKQAIRASCRSDRCKRRTCRSKACRTRVLYRQGPKGIARSMLAARGGAAQFGCLETLWAHESGWSTTAHNASTGAHGIPQALPGSKMGPGWQNNPVVQIRWGINYVYGRYGGPCGALAHWQSYNWY